MDKLTYDVVVIGAGSTGENVAERAMKGGLTAAVVESDLVAGECSYWACMPSKALLRPASALEDARSVLGAREAVTGALNVPAVFRRRDSFVSNWDDSGQVRPGSERIDRWRCAPIAVPCRRECVTGSTSCL